MGKQLPSRLKEVVYTLSPFETTVMSGLWKDLPAKLHKKVSEVHTLPVELPFNYACNICSG